MKKVMKEKTGLGIAMVLAILILGSVAEAFSGSGLGTEQSPYIITNVNQLQEMNDDLGAWYELGNDIDSSITQNWNDGAGFIPIGDWDNSFVGHFDGKKHDITGLYINRPTTNGVGLFGCSNRGSELKNIDMTDVNITGREAVGGLVGILYFGAVDNSYSTGSVNGSIWTTGGLVGYNSGTIRNSYAKGRVTGDVCVGGLLGRNASTHASIINCYSTASVSGDDYIGGLTGHSIGIISNCYSTGSVNGSRYVGGLSGDVEGYVDVPLQIVNCYSIGSVTGFSEVGGLVGRNYYGAITNSYSTGSVSGSGDYIGGLLGRGFYGSCNDCFWDVETSGQATSACGTGKTTAEMKTKATFTSWDIDNIWNIVEGVTYPFLRENNQFLINQMARPVDGWLVQRFDFDEDVGYKGHEGIDIDSGIDGKEVVAVADGMVVRVNRNITSGAGLWVWIWHGVVPSLNGNLQVDISTRYLHLKDMPDEILPGAEVVKGRTVIGKVSNTGDGLWKWRFPPHLHFEVRQGGSLNDIMAGTITYKNTMALNPLRFVGYEDRSKKPRSLVISVHSPVDLIVKDPDGLVISKNVSEISTASYFEIPLDEEENPGYELIIIDDRKQGKYLIEVVSEPNALPADTYSLMTEVDGRTAVLAEDIQIQDIPTDPYETESKLCYSDFDGNGDVDLADLATLSLHWLKQDCNYPNWCQGTDLNYSGRIDFLDFAIFAQNWLWEKIPADIDFDGDVDFADYAVLASYWLEQNCIEPIWCNHADINKDGQVDILDLVIFAENWLEGVAP